MTIFQLLMLGASAYFAYKIYEHIERLKDETVEKPQEASATATTRRTAEAFSTFDTNLLIEKADEARESGNLDKALAIYSEAKIKDTENAEVLFKMAYTLSLQKRFPEALEYFEEALTRDSENHFTHQAISSIHRNDQEFELSLKHIERAIVINPHDKVNYYNYGNLLVDMQEFQKAEEMYTKALEIDPDFSEAKNELEKLKSEK